MGPHRGRGVCGRRLVGIKAGCVVEREGLGWASGWCERKRVEREGRRGGGCAGGCRNVKRESCQVAGRVEQHGAGELQAQTVSFPHVLGRFVDDQRTVDETESTSAAHGTCE